MGIMSLKMHLKRIEILNKEVVSNNEFYAMHMNELCHTHNDHQSLKTTMCEMRVKNADLIKTGNFDIMNKILALPCLWKIILNVWTHEHTFCKKMQKLKENGKNINFFV